MEGIENETDVAVVGGGLAGLAAAAYLARGGRRVALFEKAAAIGGRAVSQEHAGYRFNLGAHALYSKTHAVQVLKELGVRYTGGTPTGVRSISGGESYVAPVDPTTLLRTRLLNSSAKWEAGRMFLKIQLADATKLGKISLREWLDREVRHDEVRRMLEATARVTTYTDCPGELSAGAAIEQLQQVAKGKVIYVDGGWQTLVDGLEKVARNAGVQMRGGVRVEAVESSPGGVTGVRLADGTLFAARAVVVAAGPQDAARLVVGQGKGNSALQSWARSAMPLKAACLDVALRKLPNPKNRVAFSLDRPLFLTTQSEFSKIAPNGGALLHALKYLDPCVAQDAEANKRELEDWVSSMQPGWRNEVVECRYLPNPIVSNAMPTTAQGGTAGRPGPQVPGIDGLYVAGDWVGPKGILASASLWSAKLAAEAILIKSNA